MRYIKKGDSSDKSLLSDSIISSVRKILEKVKIEGDSGLNEIMSRFHHGFNKIRVDDKTLNDAVSAIDGSIRKAIIESVDNVKNFHLEQRRIFSDIEVEQKTGIKLGIRFVPVESAGVYVPGGRYPLPSSAIMGITPAKVAGVKRIIACSPPLEDSGIPNVYTLAAMRLAGADEVYCLSGAQAVAAMAYGVENLKRVDMIVGPGNIYVTAAKREISAFCGIDMLAGPSEVFIIADSTTNPIFTASDLLAQCEHDPMARATLVAMDEKTAMACLGELYKQLSTLKTLDVAKMSWDEYGSVIIADSKDEAISIANNAAPEHLELHIENPRDWLPHLNAYGSCFLGKWSGESFGDYISGTNHILPTMGTARFTGGVWVGTFMRALTHQEIDPRGIEALAPGGIAIAETEGLDAHRRAMGYRTIEFK